MTTNRPGSDTSWVRRAPLAPIGFFVTWHKMTWPGRNISSMRAEALLAVSTSSTS